MDVAPLDLVNEFTVVLPQRYRSRVVKVIPHSGSAFVILIQDFTRSTKRDRGREWNQLEPLWRLFRYEPPETVAVEICTFSQSVNEDVHPVHMSRSDGGIYLLFHTQLLRVDMDARDMKNVCRLRLPMSADDEPEVRGMAVRDDMVCIVVQLGEDDYTIHWIPYGDEPVLGTHYPGGRGERVAFGPDGSTYALDMMDVYRFQDGRLVGEVDLSKHFSDWHQRPDELLAVSASGNLYVGSGQQLLVLDAELNGVIGEHQIPRPVHELHFIPGTDRLLLSVVDQVEGRLLIQEVRA